jgi:hypothetical protein
MLDLNKMRTMVAKGLKEYLGVSVIRGNQTAQAPPYPYVIYNVTTVADANNGTYQQHEDSIDRLMVRSIWSLSFLSKDHDESIMLASKAREWLMHTGRVWLAEHGITVQSTTDIINRDNILTVEYERKNGFDVVFYVYDEAENPAKTTGYIEGVYIAHEMN